MGFLPDLLHIADAAEWRVATELGTYERSTRGRSLADVGFIHMSFLWQVERVANFIYADETLDLVLLRIDAARLRGQVRVESLDEYPERFPHLYGSLPVSAVLDVRAFPRVNGQYRLPQDWHL